MRKFSAVLSIVLVLAGVAAAIEAGPSVFNVKDYTLFFPCM